MNELNNREIYERLQVVRDRLNRYDGIIEQIQNERELILDEVILIEKIIIDTKN